MVHKESTMTIVYSIRARFRIQKYSLAIIVYIYNEARSGMLHQSLSLTTFEYMHMYAVAVIVYVRTVYAPVTEYGSIHWR
jgi:hypothetical protein